MKPGESQGSFILETDEEIEAAISAASTPDDVRKFNLLKRLKASHPPMELMPQDADLIIHGLGIQSAKVKLADDARESAERMLSDFKRIEEQQQ
jgi:hypothetical protein